ncbi:hypothetical protein CYMTET_50415 [Cymbomonas tetramitiformis]|uniref:Protein kinase domain-containing protein n=1 Tax=Cymbomonas tetramitiformis TaxID=36881 RepID=A0AAE0BPD0_9CHLO|nr:hypothetical protein CYMTET_50415 [Cymbomonas tetramitiformis]
MALRRNSFGKESEAPVLLAPNPDNVDMCYELSYQLVEEAMIAATSEGHLLRSTHGRPANSGSRDCSVASMRPIQSVGSPANPAAPWEQLHPAATGNKELSLVFPGPQQPCNSPGGGVGGALSPAALAQRQADGIDVSQLPEPVRRILEMLPVTPNRVSKVVGPTLNLTKVDDNTVDVQIVNSFRAHFDSLGGGQPGLLTDPQAPHASALGGEGSRPAIGRGPSGGWDSMWNRLMLGPSGGWDSMWNRLMLDAEGEEDGGYQEDAEGILDNDVDTGMSRSTSERTNAESQAGTSRQTSRQLSTSSSATDVEADMWEIDPGELTYGERLAVGGFAEVFRGTWQGTTVAIKRLMETDSRVIERLKTEVRVLARLRHPNLLLFMGYAHSPPTIVSEFMRRGSLYNTVRGREGRPLDRARLRAVALSVARGMNYLHTRNPPILHLDLKSPNILVDDKWRVKIADFGLSKTRQRTFLSGSGGGAGTPEWMAPEVLCSMPYDERADVYSYGVVLWECLTGRSPWHDLHPMQVVAAVGFQKKQLSCPADGEPVICKLCSDCCAWDPVDRPRFTTIVPLLEKWAEETK